MQLHDKVTRRLGEDEAGHILPLATISNLGPEDSRAECGIGNVELDDARTIDWNLSSSTMQTTISHIGTHRRCVFKAQLRELGDR